ASDDARNCTCGKNWDFASHGIVTSPESHGQAGNTKASMKIARVTTRGTRAAAGRPASASRDVARSLIGAWAGSWGHRDVRSRPAATGWLLLRSIPSPASWRRALGAA